MSFRIEIEDNAANRVHCHIGNLEITDKDFGRIPDIAQNYGPVEPAGKTPQGNEVVRYRKAFNGKTYYVEEVRINSRGLAAKTLWKAHTREQMPDSIESTPLIRPADRFGGNLPETVGIVLQTENVRLDCCERLIPIIAKDHCAQRIP